MASEPWEFNWPIYIDVIDGKVDSIWYVTDSGQDGLLTEGEHYHVSYEKAKQYPKQSAKTEEDEAIDWLKPKVYSHKKEK